MPSVLAYSLLIRCSRKAVPMQNLFKAIYLIDIIVSETIRAPYRKRNRADRKQHRVADSRISAVEVVTMILAVVGYELLPAIYIFTGWPSAFDYTLPDWAGVIGTALLVVSIWLLIRAHRDLGRNWSPTLETVENHQLVTSGVYGVIRHPIYAAVWLMVLAQPLLLHNWIVGFAGIVLFAPVFFLRVPAEEKMMIEHFGDEYRAYMERVGGVVPRPG
jgi:protein-S-isoprenylcysteine O-methyltransferase Ste14